MDRLRNKVEPFAALFWALGIVLDPCPPARHHSAAVHKACTYMVIIGSILYVDVSYMSVYDDTYTVSRNIIYLQYDYHPESKFSVLWHLEFTIKTFSFDDTPAYSALNCTVQYLYSIEH